MVYLILHIPKTGGTTLSRILENTNLSVLARRDGNKVKELVSFYNNNKNKEVVLMAHQMMGIHKKLNIKPSYFTIVRDPIARMVSEYFYIKGNNKHHLYDEANKFNLVGFTKKFRSDNSQARFMIGGKEVGSLYEGDLNSQIIKNSLKKFSFVGLFEDYKNTVARILKLVGITEAPVMSDHITNTSKILPTIPKRQIASLRGMAKFDFQLYNLAKVKYTYSK